jgi:SAM-dependent methyltransferase
VLQHVADPATAICEARRILRKGSIAVFAEPDWDTLVIDYPDLPTARAYTRYVTDHVIRNPALGRQLASLAARAGFRDAREADRVLGIKRVTAGAVHAGYLGRAAADDGLGYLATQTFFASVTLYMVTATAI